MSKASLFSLLVSVWLVCSSSDLMSGDFKDKVGIGFSVNAQKLYGDTRSGDFVYGGNPLVIRYNFKPSFYFESNMGFSQLSTEAGQVRLETDMFHLGVKLGHRFLPTGTVNPLLYFGLGILNFELNPSARFWDGYGAIGGGFEIFVMDVLGLNFTGDFKYTSGDDFDGGSGQPGRDAYFDVGVGLTYYLGGTRYDEPESEFVENSPQNGISVTQVSDSLGMNEHSSDESNSDAVEKTNSLLAKKQELLQLLEEREQARRLLQTKVNTLDDQIRLLEDELYNAKKTGLEVSVSNGTENNDPFLKRYQAGLNYFGAEQFDDAIVTFKSTLTESSDHPSVYRCWYWLGECYYAREEYDLAKEAFNVLLAQAPNSSKAEVSEVMVALCEWKSGNVAKASTRLERFLEEYPYGEFAPLVYDYLKEMENKIRRRSNQ